ncbi:putative methyltransferase [Candidatus Moduliflexus flocculans]|uniref:Putative methyltransferase n=1 Tax=Candidatus Moduliflexus flocculans TaxID=1499966 RepID=A0A0S6VRH0_9BACT|nr:putative methyltransferase [Candidatus Moduliflexus flocculans]
MNIYLIKPKFPVTYWGFEYSNDLSGVTYTSGPLGLATIAALTPPEHQVEICDENIEPIDYGKPCDIVGLTGYLMQGPQIFRIAEEFRKRGKLVVLGGPITGLNLEGCRGKVDVIFVGEAEYTWKQFLEDYQRGDYKTEYTQCEPINMEDSPVPRVDLMKLKKYVHATLQTTRGCPFGCEFCDIVVLFGRKVRFKKVAQVMAELEAVAKENVESVFFTDDNFIGNKAYAKELLTAIIEFNKTLTTPFDYMTQVSINLAKDDELLELMYQANFRKVFIGIETPRKASLQEVNKGQNVRTDLLADVRKIQSYNITVSAGMIVGFDHDDEKIFQEQLDFIMEANIPWAMTGILQAVPETPLYKRLQRENRLDVSAEYFEVDNTALDVNIVPKNMTKQQLVNGYHWLVKQLYSYENYAKRVIGALQQFERRSSVPFHFPTRWQLKVVWKTFRYYLFTLDRQRRKFFLKILAYTVKHRPYMFVEAMTYIVSFKHLRHYTYEHLERILQHKDAVSVAPEPALIEVKRRLTAAYDELRKHAAHVSTQAAIAYDELKEYATHVSKQAVEEYDEVRKHAATLSKQAATAYDELKDQAGHIGKHAAEEYEELREQALAARKQASAAYEEFGKYAAGFSQQTTQHYEELRELAAVKSEQAHATYRELCRQLVVISEQMTALYEELGTQAAAMKTRAAGINTRIEELYRDLEEQANTLSRKSSLLLEDLKKHLPEFPASPFSQKG